MKQYPNLDKRQIGIIKREVLFLNRLQQRFVYAISDYISSLTPGVCPFIVCQHNCRGGVFGPFNDKTPNVYVLINENRIVYIGRTCDVNARIAFHYRTKSFTHIILYELQTFDQIKEIELKLVQEFHPALNIQLRYPQYGKA